MALSDYSNSPTSLKAFLRKQGEDDLKLLQGRMSPPIPEVQPLIPNAASIVARTMENKSQEQTKPYDPTGKTPEQIMAETGKQSELDAIRQSPQKDALERAMVRPQEPTAFIDENKSAERILAETGRQDMVDQLRGGGQEAFLKMTAKEIKEQSQPESDIAPLEGADDPAWNQNGQLMAEQAQSNGGLSFDSEIPEGYKFKPQDGDGNLGGQCAWFAQQITSLPDGSDWRIGSVVKEKASQLAGHVQSGNAFYKGQDVPQEGNSIVFNGGKYGHVAVIKEVLPNGQARLTESNYGNDLRVTHSRIISLNDPSIMGFIRTKPR